MSPNTLYIYKLDEVHIKIDCEPSIAQELCDNFTFEVPGARYMPTYRNKIWDGKIRLYSTKGGILYGGLLKHTLQFAKKRDYLVQIMSPDEFLPIEKRPLPELDLPIIPREYQLDAINHAVENEKCILLSPTASGKSLIIYYLIRYYDFPSLIVVPTTSLGEQLYKDFQSYGFDSEKYCHRIYSGKEKLTDKKIVITTWQSIYKLKPDFFWRFEVIIGDEAHGFKAKSLTDIMTKLTNCPIRIGTTGTLDGTKTHTYVLEGLFGPVYEVITTKKLMEDKYLANLNIKCIVLQYPESVCKDIKSFSYPQELEYIVMNEKRNNFIRDLVERLNGNTLVLYQLVEKHGEILYEKMNELKNKQSFFIHGGVKTDVREKIREGVETNNNSIIVASFGTYSTGINIRNLHNVVFSSPSKSRIRNLQSIGRGLRITDTKKSANLFDISDDLSYKSRNNYTLNHLLERLKIYNDQKFDYTIDKITL